MDSIKFAVEVQAGIIPQRPEPEFTKQFFVTSAEWRANNTPEALTGEGSAWAKAQEYATSLVDPNRVNWVRIDWVWF